MTRFATSSMSCVILLLTAVVGFTPSTRTPHQHRTFVSVPTADVSLRATPEKKGFGEKAVQREKTEGAVKRQESSSKYDDISAAGGQEYRIFVRQFGSDDQSWLPCGAIAVPRGSQVSDAIYANLEGLKTAIVRSYPRLKGFEEEFEFGFNLKIYPDDPVEVAKRNAPRAQGMSFGNWINTLLSPIDASSVSQPPSKE